MCPRSWKPVIQSLSKNHRCIAIDFRRWGQSSRDAEDYDLRTLANDVVAIIDDLGLKQFVILGYSMGGKVAQLGRDHAVPFTRLARRRSSSAARIASTAACARRPRRMKSSTAEWFAGWHLLTYLPRPWHVINRIITR